MVSLRQMITVSILLFTGTVLAQTALDDHYNQGRVLGGKMLRSQILADANEGENILMVAPSLFRLGDDDQTQYNIVGMPVLGLSGDVFTLGASLFGVNAVHRFAPGHRLTWFAYQDITWISLTLLGYNSLDIGPMDGSLNHVPIGASYDFLSREGAIQQKDSDFGISFYKGPLLNQGQFRLNGSIQFDIDEKAYPKLFSFSPSVGITDNLELSAQFYSSKQWGTDTLTNPGGLSQDISAQLDFRLPQLQLTLSDHVFHFERSDTSSLMIPPSISDITDHDFNLSAFLLLGKRNLTLNNVAGNWDHYYSSQLGKKQFSLSANLNPNFINDVDTISHDTSITVAPHYSLSLGYGIHDEVTVKLSYQKPPTPMEDGLSRWIEPGYFRVGLEAGNKPLRTQGPHEVSRMEYEFGPVLEKKQFRLSASATIPKLLNSISSFYYPSNYTSEYASISVSNPIVDLVSQRDLMAVNQGDLSVHASVGLGRHLQSGVRMDYYYNNKNLGSLNDNVLAMSPLIRFANEKTAVQFSTVVAFYFSNFIDLGENDERFVIFEAWNLQLVRFF